MAVTAHTLLLLEQMRATVTDITDDHTRALAAAWATAWDEVVDTLAEAVGDSLAQDLTGYRLLLAAKATSALQVIGQRLDALAAESRLVITGSLGQVVSAAAEAQAAVIASQLPDSAASLVRATDPTALDQIVERAAQQITAAHWPLSDSAERAVRRALVRGVAEGLNPRQTARIMIQRAEGAFNGGLTRALTISRTETLDAHRNAAQVTDLANTRVLTGWRWLASLGIRTCPACWAMNGTFHPVEEPGPAGHQNCRCSRAPATRSWADLGITGVPEPPSLLPDARTVFDGLPRNEQMRIMGPRRLRALNDGAPWSSLATIRQTPGWRDSVVPTPVSRLPVPVAAGR